MVSRDWLILFCGETKYTKLGKLLPPPPGLSHRLYFLYVSFRSHHGVLAAHTLHSATLHLLHKRHRRFPHHIGRCCCCLRRSTQRRTGGTSGRLRSPPWIWQPVEQPLRASHPRPSSSAAGRVSRPALCFCSRCSSTPARGHPSCSRRRRSPFSNTHSMRYACLKWSPLLLHSSPLPCSM